MEQIDSDVNVEETERYDSSRPLNIIARDANIDFADEEEPEVKIRQ